MESGTRVSFTLRFSWLVAHLRYSTHFPVDIAPQDSNSSSLAPPSLDSLLAALEEEEEEEDPEVEADPDIIEEREGGKGKSSPRMTQ